MASRSVNKVILLGHLGKDAETKFTPGGAAITKFTIATNRSVKDKQSGEWKEETDWSNVVLFNKENLSQYLIKGKQVYVEGRMQTRSYEDKDGKKLYFTEVVADDIILTQGGGGGGPRGGDEYSQATPVSMPRSAQRQAPPQAAPQQDEYGGQGITDDDVPF
jgi:single-strand DNA-binding protein